MPLKIAFVFFLFSIVAAQSKNEPIKIERINGHITLDGIPDEPVWQKIKPFPLVTHWPEFGNKPEDLSQIRVAYDDNYVYVSGILKAEPENILAASFKRDLNTLGTDYLMILLDTFNDNENTLLFSTTPTGTRSDMAISNDAETQDISWNTFWDAQAKQYRNGWSGEIRIPFSSLGFQDLNGEVEMGMTVVRYTAKKNEMYLFPAIEPNWGFWSWSKASQMQKVVFEGIKSSSPVYISPYALGGLGRRYDLNDDETAYKKENDLTKNLGLDLKYNITDNLTLDFSVNTDFAQVEADDQQVNLTRFSLFFPEKRRFFLERASIFDFNFGESNRLFYTRRIGLNDGRQVDIIAGGRMVGRIKDWDVGVLNVQTNHQGSLAAENFGVLRVRKQVFNPYSYLGGMATSRVDENGTYNLGYGLDGVFRLFGNDYLVLQVAQTYADTLSSGFDYLNAGRMRMVWERRSYTDFSYEFSAERSGKDYNPVNGFEMRDNFSHLGNQLSYGWALKGHSFLQRHRFYIMSDLYTRNQDNNVETLEIRPVWESAMTSGSFLSIGADAVHEHLREGYDLSDDVQVLSGEYNYYDVFVEFSTPGGNELSSDMFASYGSFFDGTRFSAGLFPKWIASKYLEFTGSYQFDFIDFSERNQKLTSHLFQLKNLITLNTKISLATFIQYSNTAKISLANARFRYNPSEGNDFYLVYNEQFNMERRRELPVLPFSQNRTLIAKYTYTFTL